MNNIDILELLAKKIEEQTSIIASCSSIINKKAEARERTEYIKIKEFVETLIAENKELKEKVKAYETECRRFKAFCKKIRKDEKHDVDLFNQGQEQKCNEFLNLIEGEQHWNYEGKYFDETDKQIEDMKQSLLGKE